MSENQKYASLTQFLRKHKTISDKPFTHTSIPGPGGFPGSYCIPDNKLDIFYEYLYVMWMKVDFYLCVMVLFQLLKLFYHKGFNRIIVETGITLINLLRKYKLINNMYVYQSNRLLSINGLNKINNLHLKNQKKINIYLYGDKVFKLKLKNYV